MLNPKPSRKLGLLLVPSVLLLALALLAAACGGGEEATPTATATASPTRTTGGSPAASPTKTPTAATSPTAGATTVDIKMVPSLKFDKTKLTIAADKNVTFTVDNTDTGISHNFAVFRSKADADAGMPPLAKTDTCAGPCKKPLPIKLAPGEYFFRCDLHPAQMTGTLTAQ